MSSAGAARAYSLWDRRDLPAAGPVQGPFSSSRAKVEGVVLQADVKIGAIQRSKLIQAFLLAFFLARNIHAYFLLEHAETPA